MNANYVAAGVAVFVGLLVSYYPPAQNGAAIWALVGYYLSHMAGRWLSKANADSAAPQTPTVAQPAAVPYVFVPQMNPTPGVNGAPSAAGTKYDYVNPANPGQNPGA